MAKSDWIAPTRATVRGPSPLVREIGALDCTDGPVPAPLLDGYADALDALDALA